MEEKILDIMNENSSDANNGQMSVITDDSYWDVAKEITAHVMDFIDFLLTGCDGIFIQTHKKDEVIYFRDCNNDSCSLNRVYEYWLKNIEK